MNRANNEIDRKERKISGLEETIKSKNDEIKLYSERAEKYGILLHGLGENSLNSLLEKARENLRIESERRRAERQRKNRYIER